MASVFFIKTDSGVIYELSSTVSAEVTKKSKIAKHRVEDKSVVADNAFKENAVVSFSGIISNIRRLDQLDYVDPFQHPIDFITGAKPEPHNYKTYREYLEGIDTVMNQSEFVTFHIDTDLTPINNCSITDFTYTKDYSGGITSWKVDLKGEQIRTSSRAARGTIPTPASGVSSVVEGAVSGSGASGSQATPLTETILVGLTGG